MVVGEIVGLVLAIIVLVVLWKVLKNIPALIVNAVIGVVILLVLNIFLDSTGIDPADRDASVSLSCPSNPCLSNPSVSVELARPGNVAVRVFGIDGRLEGILFDGSLGAGSHALAWPGSLPSGIYIVRADAGSSSGTLRLVVLE